MFNNLRKKTLEASGKLPDAGFGFFQNVKQKFDSTVDDLSSTASRLKDNVMITSPMKDENSEDNMDDNVSMMSTDLTEVELLKKRNDKLKERLEKLRIEKEKVKNILSSTQDQALEKCEELRRTINEERLENGKLKSLNYLKESLCGNLNEKIKRLENGDEIGKDLEEKISEEIDVIDKLKKNEELVNELFTQNCDEEAIEKMNLLTEKYERERMKNKQLSEDISRLEESTRNNEKNLIEMEEVKMDVACQTKVDDEKKINEQIELANEEITMFMDLEEKAKKSEEEIRRLVNVKNNYKESMDELELKLKKRTSYEHQINDLWKLMKSSNNDDNDNDNKKLETIVEVDEKWQYLYKLIENLTKLYHRERLENDGNEEKMKDELMIFIENKYGEFFEKFKNSGSIIEQIEQMNQYLENGDKLSTTIHQQKKYLGSLSKNAFYRNLQTSNNCYKRHSALWNDYGEKMNLLAESLTSESRMTSVIFSIKLKLKRREQFIEGIAEHFDTFLENCQEHLIESSRYHGNGRMREQLMEKERILKKYFYKKLQLINIDEDNNIDGDYDDVDEEEEEEEEDEDEEEEVYEIIDKKKVNDLVVFINENNDDQTLFPSPTSFSSDLSLSQTSRRRRDQKMDEYRLSFYELFDKFKKIIVFFFVQHMIDKYSKKLTKKFDGNSCENCDVNNLLCLLRNELTSTKLNDQSSNEEIEEEVMKELKNLKETKTKLRERDEALCLLQQQVHEMSEKESNEIEQIQQSSNKLEESYKSQLLEKEENIKNLKKELVEVKEEAKEKELSLLKQLEIERDNSHDKPKDNLEIVQEKMKSEFQIQLEMERKKFDSELEKRLKDQRENLERDHREKLLTEKQQYENTLHQIQMENSNNLKTFLENEEKTKGQMTKALSDEKVSNIKFRERLDELENDIHRYLPQLIDTEKELAKRKLELDEVKRETNSLSIQLADQEKLKENLKKENEQQLEKYEKSLKELKENLEYKSKIESDDILKEKEKLENYYKERLKVVTEEYDKQLKNLSDENEKRMKMSNEEQEQIIRNLSEENEEKMKRISEEYEQTIKNLLEEHEQAIKILSEENERRVAKLSEEYEVKIGNLSKVNEEKLEKLLEANDEKIRKLSVENEEKMENLLDDERKVTKLSEEYEVKIRNSSKVNEEKLTKLSKENEEKLTKLSKVNEEKLTKLSEEYEEKISQLSKENEEKLKELSNENLNNLKIKEEELKRQYEIELKENMGELEKRRALHHNQTIEKEIENLTKKMEEEKKELTKEFDERLKEEKDQQDNLYQSQLKEMKEQWKLEKERKEIEFENKLENEKRIFENERRIFEIEMSEKEDCFRMEMDEEKRILQSELELKIGEQLEELKRLRTEEKLKESKVLCLENDLEERKQRWKLENENLTMKFEKDLRENEKRMREQEMTMNELIDDYEKKINSSKEKNTEKINGIVKEKEKLKEMMNGLKKEVNNAKENGMEIEKLLLTKIESIQRENEEKLIKKNVECENVIEKIQSINEELDEMKRMKIEIEENYEKSKDDQSNLKKKIEEQVKEIEKLTEEFNEWKLKEKKNADEELHRQLNTFKQKYGQKFIELKRASDEKCDRLQFEAKKKSNELVEELSEKNRLLERKEECIVEIQKTLDQLRKEFEEKKLEDISQVQPTAHMKENPDNFEENLDDDDDGDLSKIVTEELSMAPPPSIPSIEKELRLKIIDLENELFEMKKKFMSLEEEKNQLIIELEEKDKSTQRYLEDMVMSMKEKVESNENQLLQQIGKLKEEVRELQEKNEEMLTDNNSEKQHISIKKLDRVIETEDEKEKEKNSFKSQLALLQTRVEQQNNLINELHQKYQTQIRDLQIKSENIADNPQFGYLRRVLFEYIMGHEQNTMIKVIVAILQFPTEEGTQLIKRTEENHVHSLTPWYPYIGKK